MPLIQKIRQVTSLGVRPGKGRQVSAASLVCSYTISEWTIAVDRGNCHRYSLLIRLKIPAALDYYIAAARH